MRVRESDYDDILYYLQKQRWDNGMEIVAYPIDGAGVDRTDLLVFANVEEATNSIGNDESYDYSSIRSVINTMREGTEDHSLRRYSAAFIDVGLMTEERTNRLGNNTKIQTIMETQVNKSKEELLEETIAYNKESAKYMGFKGLDDQIEKGIRSGEKKFQVNYEGEFDGKKVNAELNFRNGDTRSFWNNYELTVSDPQKPENTRSNKIYLDETGRGLSLKKAFNQLEGRAVYAQFSGEKTMDGQKTPKYNAWEIALLNEPKIEGRYQPHKFNDNYGFNTVDALKALNNSYALIDGEYKKITISNVDDELTHKSLKTGNRQGVRATIDGKNTTLYVEANPGDRKLNPYTEKTGGVALEVVTERQKAKIEGKNRENTDPGNPEKGKQEEKAEKKEKEKDKGEEQEENQNQGKKRGK